jgi:urease accessory protein
MRRSRFSSDAKHAGIITGPAYKPRHPMSSSRSGAPAGARRSPLPLVRLLQLASPALPIGAYSYSQGLEWVVAEGVVHDAASAHRWIGDVMEHVVAPGEAAVLGRLLDAAAGCDWSTFERWNAWFRASRETAELRAETEQTGGSLAKLLQDLELLDAAAAMCCWCSHR